MVKGILMLILFIVLSYVFLWYIIKEYYRWQLEDLQHSLDVELRSKKYYLSKEQYHNQLIKHSILCNCFTCAHEKKLKQPLGSPSLFSYTNLSPTPIEETPIMKKKTRLVKDFNQAPEPTFIEEITDLELEEVIEDNVQPEDDGQNDSIRDGQSNSEITSRSSPVG